MSFENRLLALSESGETDQDPISLLRSHSEYQSFMKKWQIEVYFRLVSSKILSSFDSESAVTTATDSSVPEAVKDDDLILPASISLLKCIHSCWKDDIHLCTLSHRMWKLTSDLISKYRSWLEKTLPPAPEAEQAPEEDGSGDSRRSSSAAPPSTNGDMHQQVLMNCLSAYNDARVLDQKVCILYICFYIRLDQGALFIVYAPKTSRRLGCIHAL